MTSSHILIIALSIAILSLLMIMTLIIVHRRKSDKTPPSRIAFVPIIITGVGILFILALMLAKQPCTTDTTTPHTIAPPQPAEQLNENVVDQEKIEPVIPSTQRPDRDDSNIVEANIEIDDLAADCEKQGGNWLAKHDECEYAGRDWCDEYDATFLECESACRHDPNAQICTMQCIPVCLFE